LVGTGRKFAELNVETGKRELEDVPLVEAFATLGMWGKLV
jgi:DNA recombination protein RmuC